jgi:hypothetical protein
MSRGKWASGVRALKGSRECGGGRKCTDVGASTTGVRRREVRTGPNRWRPRASGRGRARARRETTPTGLAHRATGGREGERARGRDRLTGEGRLSARTGTRARAGPTRLAWAKLVFPFFLEFLMLFYFIFPRVFNSNSNQVSNSN